MCNRYALSKKQERLITKQYGSVELFYQLRFNIAPTQLAPVVLVENGKLASRNMQWGFKPAWSKSPVTNAQIETLDKKPTFKDAFAKRRCLVPASGFYEWQDFNGSKQPILFCMANEQPFFFGGLWSTKDATGHFIIITTAANQFVRDVHNRMPLIVAPNDYDAWLDMGSDSYKHMAPTDDELKTIWVSTGVNNSRNEGEASAQPLTATVANFAGAYALPAGLPEGEMVKIRGFKEGYFDVYFKNKIFHVHSACVNRNGW
jgi:putative SOS response-associated peptidase YedK